MNNQNGIRYVSIIVVVIAFCLCIMTIAAQAAIPETINYQGYLTDATGNPVNGNVSMTFRIYTTASGGTALWTETQTVSVNDGIYNVVLGSVTSLGALAFDVPYYLGITVGTDAEMTPRQPLTSVAYAFTADTALSVANNAITSAMIQDGSVSSADVNFTYAGSTSKGGPATDLFCTGCVSQSELDFAAGDITEVIAGTGLNGGGGSGSVTLSADTSYLQRRVSGSCPAGQSIQMINPDGSVSCYADTVGWGLTGNAGTNPSIHFIGTTDNQELRFRVNSAIALRIVPNATSPNIIGGYSDNWISKYVYGATIGGGGSSGYLNRVTDNYGTVGGGRNNQAGDDAGTADDKPYATVGGGHSNNASGDYATVGGGTGNSASGYAATVGGGYSNFAGGIYATVGGGIDNTASGFRATVPGGFYNLAAGDLSFAAGNRARANNHGCFVWGDATAADVSCNNDNRWVARASGGVYFYTNAELTSGVRVLAGGGTWGSLSDRNMKENFAPVDGKMVLARLSDIPIATWNYKSQDASIRHMGPVAQDFYAAFGVGEDDTHISTVDADGVALAAIQGLYQMVREQRAEIESIKRENMEIVGKLEQENRELREAIAAITRQLAGLAIPSALLAEK